MIPDLEPPPLQPQTAETSFTQPPEHGHRPSLSAWVSSVSKEGITECNAKTLAARRKRSEIRRLKLRVAADEELAEPLLKRSKLVGSRLDSASTCGMLRGCEPDNMTGAHKPITDIGMSNVATGTSMPQEPCANQDQDGSLELRCRPPFSCTDAACPTHCIVSICGRSRFMEDAAIAVPAFLSMPYSVARHGGSAQHDTFNFYGVYDGHGGVQAAEFCKERLHGWLAEEISAAANTSPSHLEACMQTCFKRIDDELCGVCPHGSECPRKADAGSSSCRVPLVPGSVGTTAVVAVVGAHHIVVGNCGDSRAVLCSAGEAVPLSVDHKANRPDEVARIEAAGGQVFTWQGHRVCGVLAMSRALGDGFLKPYVIGQPEVMVMERTDDDECLILATDGLWDVLSSKYVCKVARKAMANWRRDHTNFQHRYPLFAHHSEEQQQACNGADADGEDSPAQVVAAMLVKLALAKNSKDNISVVVVDLKRL